MHDTKKQFKNKIALSLILVVGFMTIFSVVGAASLFAQTSHEEDLSDARAEVKKIGLIAAAIAFGFGAIGAGIAIANVGAAAMGAIAEKPEIGGQALIFIALAEGLVVFGFITALMIMGNM